MRFERVLGGSLNPERWRLAVSNADSGPGAMHFRGSASTSADARTGGPVVPPSRGIHDRADRLDNDPWLLEGDNMARLVRNNLTATLRQSNLVAL
jgi:hypothetical protein